MTIKLEEHSAGTASAAGNYQYEINKPAPYLEKKSFSLTKVIPVKPVSTALQTQGSGFQTIKQRNALEELEVAFSTDKVKAGSKIYVRGNAVQTMSWSKEIFDMRGQKVWLCPEDRVEMVFEE
jgi:hypothetical protein